VARLLTALRFAALPQSRTGPSRPGPLLRYFLMMLPYDFSAAASAVGASDFPVESASIARPSVSFSASVFSGQSNRSSSRRRAA